MLNTSLMTLGLTDPFVNGLLEGGACMTIRFAVQKTVSRRTRKEHSLLYTNLQVALELHVMVTLRH